MDTFVLIFFLIWKFPDGNGTFLLTFKLFSRRSFPPRFFSVLQLITKTVTKTIDQAKLSIRKKNSKAALI